MPMVACALLLAAFAATSWRASLTKCATIDEPGYLVSAWMMTHDDDFRLDCENPPPWKYFVAVGTRQNALPIDPRSPGWAQLLRQFDYEEVYASNVLYRTPGVNPDALIRAGRARMLVLGVALGVLIGWFGWRLGGPVAAVVAVAAFCLDPNFLAHAMRIKNDVAAALALLLLSAGIWLLGERGTVWRWLVVSLFLGLAVTVKMSGILGIAILAAALLVRSLINQPWPIGRWLAKTRRQRLAAGMGMFLGSLLCAWIFIWASYGFRYNLSRDPAVQFDLRHTLEQSAYEDFFARNSGGTQQLQYLDYDRDVRNWRPPVGVRLILWAMNHRLLPASYLNGLLITYGMSAGRLTFLCGQFSVTGWWYYFPLAMLFKTPLTTLVGLALAALVVVSRGLRTGAVKMWPVIATAITPVLYMLAAMHTHVNIGLRHVLPVYPYLFIFMGVAAAMAWRRMPRITAAAIVLLIVGLAAETYAAYPDFIPFFNVAAGGARGGLNLLGDSNIDMGQDLPALAAWQRQNPDRQLYLLYWGTADPRYYDIHYINMYQSTAPRDQITPSGMPKVVAISAAVLTNYKAREADPSLFNAVLSQQPIAVLGGSIYLFALP
jgi:4-amino-4-deoxy-L-arabinose transferase-like glycosyltransferase